MAIKVTEEIKEQLKDENPLKDVMIDYGFEFNQAHKTCCPFHSEKTPSFHVRENGRFRCYGCDAGADEANDVIAFVMCYEELDFQDACRVLAERAGIELPEYRPNPEMERLKKQRTELNRQLYYVLKQDEDALAYLYERGLDDKDIARWRIGMMPWDGKNKMYAGRIVFGMSAVGFPAEKSPTIAMAYRARELEDYAKHGFDLTTEEARDRLMGAKYINDRTDLIYEKSKFLYGLNEARQSIRKAKHVVLMEGYMDVITAHKHGLTTAVASCGTAITEEQVIALRKAVGKAVRDVYLWLDGDEAGLQGMKRALPHLLKHGFRVHMISSPAGQDPDDIIQNVASPIQYIKDHARPALQVLMDITIQEYDTVMHMARTKALEELLPLLEQIQRPSDKMNYEAAISSRLHLHRIS